MAVDIRLGSITPSAVYVGSQSVTKIYLGAWKDSW